MPGRPYGSGEIAAQFGVPCWAEVGWDPRSAGVLSDGVDDGEALPRAGGVVEMQAQRFGPGGAPQARDGGIGPGHVRGSGLTASDSPKSPAGSVHHSVCRSPAAANSAATPSGRNLHDTSVNISSPASNSTDKSSSRI